MSFHLQKTYAISTLQAQCFEYLDDQTGIRHIHLQTDDTENSFLMAFQTRPTSDNGVAHILEHTVLSGSEKYPVRDPFFSMSNRSAATFMNALTYPDMTAYPFATPNRQDFFHLMDIYVDATLFPLLREQDFRQEGWRYEVAEKAEHSDQAPGSASSSEAKLAYQGIVFNEMIGFLSDPSSVVDVKITQAVNPGFTEYGGNPLAIPNLTREELVAFHKEFYHPSRAVMMSWGHIPAAEIQAAFEASTAGRFDPSSFPAPLSQGQTLAIPVTAPKSVDILVPATQELEQDHALVMSWVMGDRSDEEALFNAQILEAILLSNPSCPLMDALENAGFGRLHQRGGSQDCGEVILFEVGMAGLDAAEIPKAKKFILKTLKEIASELEMDADDAQRFLKDQEFSLYDYGHNGDPRGMEVLLHALPDIVGGRPAAEALDPQRRLDWAKDKLQNPRFISELIDQVLLKNPHRIDSTTVPDTDFFARQERQLAEQLLKAEASLSADDVKRLQQESLDLKAYQLETRDLSVLPLILVKDLEPQAKNSPAVRFKPHSEGISEMLIEAHTPHLCALSVETDVSLAPADLWPWLSLYTALAKDMGWGNRSATETDLWRLDRCTEYSLNLSLETATYAASTTESTKSTVMAAPKERPPFSQPASASDASGPSMLSTLSTVITTSNDGVQKEIHSVIPAYLEHPQGVKLWIMQEARSTLEDIAGMAEVLIEGAQHISFEDTERLDYFIRNDYQDRLGSLAEYGNDLASMEASAIFSADAAAELEISGLSYIDFLRRVTLLLDQPEGVSYIQKRLYEASDFISKSPSVVMGMGDTTIVSEGMTQVREALLSHQGIQIVDPLDAALFEAHTQTEGPQLSQKNSLSLISPLGTGERMMPLDQHTPTSRALVSSTNVNYCYQSYPTVRRGHPDYAALQVLSHLISDGYLHQAIREVGGAYGEGASQSIEGDFKFSSYRDPQFKETYDAFRQAIEWVCSASSSGSDDHSTVRPAINSADASDVNLLSSRTDQTSPLASIPPESSAPTQEQVDTAILQVIKELDRTHAPYYEGRRAFRQVKQGLSPSMIQSERDAILSCDLARIIEVAQTYLLNGTPQNRAFIGESFISEAQALGFETAPIEQISSIWMVEPFSEVFPDFQSAQPTVKTSKKKSPQA